MVDDKKLRLPMLIFMVAFSACWCKYRALHDSPKAPQLTPMVTNRPHQRLPGSAELQDARREVGLAGNGDYVRQPRRHHWQQSVPVVRRSLVSSRLGLSVWARGHGPRLLAHRQLPVLEPEQTAEEAGGSGPLLHLIVGKSPPAAERTRRRHDGN